MTSQTLFHIFALLLTVLAKDKFPESNGSIQVFVSTKGLDYGIDVFMKVLERKIVNTSLPPSQGSAKSIVGNVNYEIRNARVTSFKKKSSTFESVPERGLFYQLTGGEMAAAGNWSFAYKKLFVNMNDTGTFTAQAKNVSVGLSFSLVRNKNGGLAVTSITCKADIGDISFRLSGGYSWLYNIFKGMYTKSLMKNFADVSCSKIQSVMDAEGNPRLASFNTSVVINDALTMNFGLTKSPQFGNNAIIFHLNGTFVNDTVVETNPVVHPILSRMVSISISEVTFNSAVRMLFLKKSFKFSINFGNPRIADIFAMALNAKEFDDEIDGYPGKNFPNGTRAKLLADVTGPPSIGISTNGISLSAIMIVNIDLVFLNGTKSNLFKIGVKLGYQLQPEIKKGMVACNIASSSVNITSTTSNDDNTNKMRKIISLTLDLFLPSINKRLAKGIPLPNINGIQFVEGIVLTRERYISIGISADYKDDGA